MNYSKNLTDAICAGSTNIESLSVCHGCINNVGAHDTAFVQGKRFL